MIILKFGGTSVNSAEKIQTIYKIVNNEQRSKPVVVVSALRGVTDLLLSLMSISKKEQKKVLQKIIMMHCNLADELFDINQSQDLKNIFKQLMRQLKNDLGRKLEIKMHTDKILSYGEIFSTHFISYSLSRKGIVSEPVYATSFIVTNNNFGFAEFLPQETKEKIRKIIIPIVKEQKVPVVTGFIGATKTGQTTTLGRGGSDYSASILGFALDAKEIQIWTDVDGIYTADPKVVEDALPLRKISYQEASELAAFGAKVLHPRTIRPAISAGIPVWVKSTLFPEKPGTEISHVTKEESLVRAVAMKNKVTLINICSTEMLFSKGFLQKIFSIFERHSISVDLVSVSEVSVSVTLDNDEKVENVVKELSQFSSVTMQKENGIVSLIGEGIVQVKHIIKNIFNLLDEKNISIKMISLGATSINISLVVPTSQVIPAVRFLHDKFIFAIKGGEKL